MEIKEIKFESKEYQKLLAFRFKNLREPLKLDWAKKDLLNEDQQVHFALVRNSEIIGSLCLKKINKSTIKIRQMAIKKKFQKKGYGSKLLNFAEIFANKKKYNKIILVARLSALNFYKKNFFETSGTKFIEVTVYSIKMFKNI